MKSRLIALTALGLVALGAPAYAHHSGAMFDRAQVKTLTGTVKDFQWTNPHSSFSVEVLKPDGSTEQWQFEMNGPQNLVRLGWKRNTIKPGDKITVTYNPLRDGAPGGWYLGVTLPNGKTLGGEPAKP